MSKGDDSFNPIVMDGPLYNEDRFGPYSLDMQPQMMDMSALEDVLGPDAFRLSPATLANRMSHGEWIPARHLLYLSKIIAHRLMRGGARLIISLPPRHGKPILVDEKVLMGDGTYKRLGDIEIGDYIITHKGRSRKVLNIFEQGNLPAVMLITRHGRFITAALDHPFLTQNGWKKAEQLTTEDFLAIRHSQEIEPTIELSNEEARLAGYFVGDGCCVYQNKNSENFSKQQDVASRLICHDPEELEDIYHVVKTLGFGIRHVNEGRYDLKGGVRDWLREFGLAGKDSHTKRVPEKLFKASKEAIANFLGAYFACDGSVCGHKRQYTVNPLFVSCNPELLNDVQSLLLRLGINSRLSSRWHTGGYNKKYGGSAEFRLEVNRRDDVERFAEIIPIPGVKAQRLQDKMQEIYGQKRPRATIFGEGIFDDQIKEIEEVGEVECRCLEIEEDHTFTVQDAIVHNSELISHWTSVWALDQFPHWELILASYGADLATDFGRKVRDTILMDRDPIDGEGLLSFELNRNSLQVGRWHTTQGGGMRSVGVGGTMYGRGAHLLLIDDYFKNPEEAMSETHREKVFEWFSTIAMSRLAPGGNAIIIATRWHKDDLSGRLLRLPNSRWEEISIPVYAMENDLLDRVTGEVLWPERYDYDAIEELRETMTSYFFSAIMQQDPKPSQSASFNPKDVTIVDEQHLPQAKFLKKLRSWDLAGTEDGGDWTVGTLCARDVRNNNFYILKREREQFAPGKVETLVETTMENDTIEVRVLIEQEPGSSGKAVIEGFISRNPTYSVHGERHTGDKMVRMEGFFAAAEHKRVYMLRAPWNDEMLDELVELPDGSHDDQGDTLSQAYNELFKKKSKAGTFGRSNLKQIVGESVVSTIAPVSGQVITGVVFGR